MAWYWWVIIIETLILGFIIYAFDIVGLIKDIVKEFIEESKFLSLIFKK